MLSLSLSLSLSSSSSSSYHNQMDKNVWLLQAPQGVLERVPATEDQHRDHCSGRIPTLPCTEIHFAIGKYLLCNCNLDKYILLLCPALKYILQLVKKLLQFGKNHFAILTNTFCYSTTLPCTEIHFAIGKKTNYFAILTNTFCYSVLH